MWIDQFPVRSIASIWHTPLAAHISSCRALSATVELECHAWPTQAAATLPWQVQDPPRMSRSGGISEPPRGCFSPLLAAADAMLQSSMVCTLDS
jgi:hypothetical protein